MQTMEMYTGYFNLLKTIMGAGIVSYPLFFVEFGIVTATVLSVAACALTFSSIVMLCKCAEYTESNGKTFTDVLGKIYPGLGSMFNWVVFTKCFGVSISYLVLLQPLLLYILNMANIQSLSSISTMQITFLYTLIMFPVCAMKDLKSLKYTSVIGVLGVCICVVASAYNYMRVHGLGGSASDTAMFRPPMYSWIGFAGQFVFSFTCHQNIFGIRASLSNPTIRKMKIISFFGLGTALVLYVVFGILVYMTYGNKIEDNVFSSFIDGSVKNIVFVFYTVFISCSLPLQIHPARDCLTEWILCFKWVGKQEKNKTMVRVFSTGAILFACAMLALIPMGLSTIQTAVGGSASAIMCNFLPAICFLKIPIRKTVIERMAAVALIAYGALAFTGVFIKLQNTAQK
ncbi:uncharacterized protein NEMAJ01_2107 [Nematocida major]|uniref:uncharacterized protein n=1 Tax=Nematocida major TaxID=1912982 RepID=UPI002007DC19|nr:uncharacterized protein NEMAJ01_2107 [Nematocida major]KAH9387211.1 hypothetical protein NEMAJ01_2107 [Nematocida major]